MCSRRRALPRRPIRWRNWRRGLTSSCIRQCIPSWGRTGQRNAPPIYYRQSTATDLGAMAKRVGAKYLMLTHLVPPIGAERQGPWRSSGRPSDGSGLPESGRGERIYRKHCRGDRSRERPPSGEVNKVISYLSRATLKLSSFSARRLLSNGAHLRGSGLDAMGRAARQQQWHHRRCNQPMERPMPQPNDLSRSLFRSRTRCNIDRGD